MLIRWHKHQYFKWINWTYGHGFYYSHARAWRVAHLELGTCGASQMVIFLFYLIKWDALDHDFCNCWLYCILEVNCYNPVAKLFWVRIIITLKKLIYTPQSHNVLYDHIKFINTRQVIKLYFFMFFILQKSFFSEFEFFYICLIVLFYHLQYLIYIMVKPEVLFRIK